MNWPLYLFALSELVIAFVFFQFKLLQKLNFLRVNKLMLGNFDRFIMESNALIYSSILPTFY
jgi:hypothetical protein